MGTTFNPDLFKQLPDHIQERLPRSVKDESGLFETIYVDGQEFRRELPQPDPNDPTPRKKFGGINARPVGTQSFVWEAPDPNPFG